MLDTDKKAFTELLRATLDVYGKETSVGVITIWWEALRRFEYAEVRAAFSRYLQNVDTGQFAPKPADIIRVLEGGSTEGRALGAWTKVHDAIRLVGSYQSLVFDDPIIHAVVQDMGGWISLCSIQSEEVPFRATEFQKRYRAAIHNPPRSYPCRLIGISEAENGRNGLQIEPPMLIGDESACQRVLASGSTAPRLQIKQAGDVLGGLLEKAPTS